SKLAAEDAGREFLRDQLIKSDDLRVRAASLTALIDAGDANIDLRKSADQDSSIGIRATAIRTLAAGGSAARPFLETRYPAELRREAIVCLRTSEDLPRLLQLLNDPDPFIRSATVHQLAQCPDLLVAIDRSSPKDARIRIGILLAHRASGRPEGLQLIPQFLADPDEDVRFLAAKWIADQQLARYRPLLVEALKDRTLNVRMYMAYSTALARVDKQEVNEAKMAEYFVGRLDDESASPALRVKSLQVIPPTHPKLTLDLLGKFLDQPEAALQLEAARALSEYPKPERFALLLKIARDPQRNDDVRAQAILGLADQSEKYRDELVRIAMADNPKLRDEALRALVQT